MVRAALCVIVMACTGASAPGADHDAQDTVPRNGASYVPDTTWRTARASQIGLDSARLAALSQRLQSGAIADISSLLIVREGYLVVERYFNGSRRDDVHTMQSVSKSVTSLVAGIAADQGKVDPQSLIFDVLPGYDDLAASDPRKRQISLRHLLEMRAGINFHESPYAGSPLERLNNSGGDWVRVALEPAMNALPGERWQYNSGGVIAIAAAVRRLTGVQFDEFARTHLFRRIGITTERWSKSPYDGLAHSGGGLSLRPVDLARVGYLVLRDGRWGSDTIVSSVWLRAALAPVTLGAANHAGHRTDYGRLWWLFSIDATGSSAKRQDAVYTGIGNLNQWLFVIPRYDLVVVVTGKSNAAFGAPAAFLFSDILPAVRQ